MQEKIPPTTQEDIQESLELTPEPTHWEAFQDPEERLAAFLEQEAELFAASTESWQTVRSGQIAFKKLLAPFDEVEGVRPNRERRRNIQKQLSRMSKQLTGFHQPKYTGLKMAENALEDPDIKDYEEALDFVGSEADHIRKHVTESLEKHAMPQAVEQAIGATLTIGHQYANAFTLQHYALQKIGTLLEDDAIVPHFVEYIREISAVKDARQSTNPDLLELVAIDAVANEKSYLHDAVSRIAPEPSHYASEFLDLSYEHRRKELSAALGMTSLAVSIVENEYGIPRSDFLSRVAARAEDWAPELQTELFAYTRGRNVSTWTNIQNMLVPFVREGRVQTNPNDVRVTSLTAEQQNNRVPLSRENRRKQQTLIVRSRQNNEDVANELEPKVNRFAVLRRNGGQRELYDYDEAGSLEELYNMANFRNYAERHQQDKTIEPAIKAALGHLVMSPRDLTCTTKLHQIHYELDTPEGIQKRTPRRFKLKNFPGIAIGDITESTRVLYDVTHIEDDPVLLVHGAFIKQDLESVIKLPRHR